MSIRKWVFLWGMPGSGKSTLGKNVAAKLKFTWLDLDSIIENGEKKSISDLFQLVGEDEFRRIEKNYLQQGSFPDLMILSCGGGTPAFFDNVDYMKKHGTCVYLKCSASFLASRLKEDAQNRPLLKDKQGSELVEKLQEILEKRKAFYECADITLQLPASRPDSELVDILLNLKWGEK